MLTMFLVFSAILRRLALRFAASQRNGIAMRLLRFAISTSTCKVWLTYLLSGRLYGGISYGWDRLVVCSKWTTLLWLWSVTIKPMTSVTNQIRSFLSIDMRARTIDRACLRIQATEVRVDVSSSEAMAGACCEGSVSQLGTLDKRLRIVKRKRERANNIILEIYRKVYK